MKTIRYLAFAWKTAILESSRNLVQLKRVIFMGVGIHFLSEFTKTNTKLGYY